MAEAKNKQFKVPAQPSFDVMQQVAVPNYKLNELRGSSSSYVNRAFPNIANINTNSLFNTNIPFSKAHELQHQITGIAEQKGQLQTNPQVENDLLSFWDKNASELGVRGSKAYIELIKKLDKPEVKEYFTKMGAKPNSRILDPINSSFDELMADIGAWQTITGKDITQDKFLQKNVFTNSTLAPLVKSVTGMSGVVIGDSDYNPYSLQAAEAYGAQLPKSAVQQAKEYITNMFYKDPFGDTTK